MKTNRACGGSAKSSDLDFENLVELYYRDLFRFALSMARNEADAFDLTQQTFYIWAIKGHQLRDAANVRAGSTPPSVGNFCNCGVGGRVLSIRIGSRRPSNRGPISPALVDRIDARTMLRCLSQIDESFRAPLVLFFLKELSYKRIAQVLEIPLGTVQSRIARAKAHLYQLLTHVAGKGPNRQIAARPDTRSNQSDAVRGFQPPIEQERSLSMSGRAKAIFPQLTFETRRAA